MAGLESFVSLEFPSSVATHGAASIGNDLAVVPGEASEFVSALDLHFSQSFVTRLSAETQGGDAFLVLCSRASGVDGPELQLTVTDCLSGVFSAQLSRDKLAELRGSSGMAEFAWAGFLRLLAMALRNAEGCRAEVKLTGTPGPACARLALSYELEAATLVSSLSLDLRAAAPELPSQLAENYLRALRMFTLDAVEAAASTSKSSSHTNDAALVRGALLYGTLSNPASLTSSNRRLDHSSPATGAAVRKPAPKKRLGGSLVDPNARKRAPGLKNANPFKLTQ